MAKHRSSHWRTQNFLRSAAVIEPILDRSGIVRGDVVLDIGAGTGTITGLLLARGAHVIAVEQDPELCGQLQHAFTREGGVAVVCGDFLRVRLPSERYKVFANPPFDITSSILSKLIDAANPPDDAFLIVQREAADRCVGVPAETLYALLLKPWFAPTIVHRFRRHDFIPAPGVDVVMLRLRKRGPPLVASEHRHLYRDFVVACFTAWEPSIGDALRRAVGTRTTRELLRQVDDNGEERPSRVSFGVWLELFAAFSKMPAAVARRVLGAERRLRAQQRRLRKRHRTRVPRDDPSGSDATAPLPSRSAPLSLIPSKDRLAVGFARSR